MLTKHHIWMALGRSDVGLSLLSSYVRLRRVDIAVTDPETDIVIEGYPRSANTLSVAAFRVADGNRARIAHHVHSPLQIVRAQSWGIPAILLIREPLGAVSSMAVRDPSIDLQRALRDYIGFYEPFISRTAGIVIGEFSSVISGFDQIVREVNARFQKEFVIPASRPGDDEMVARLVDDMDKRDRGSAEVDPTSVALPNEARRKKSELVREKMLAPSMRNILDDARRIFEAITADSNSREVQPNSAVKI